MAMPILRPDQCATTRSEAKERGLTTYFSGVACANGHLSPRATSNNECIECKNARRRVANIRAKFGVQKVEELNAKERERRARWREENRERIREYKRTWREANRDRVAKHSATWREQNKDRQAEYVRDWILNNPDRVRIYWKNRKKRVRKCGGKLSSDIIQKLMKLQKGKCACCRKPLGSDFHLDHIIPLYLGGTNTDDNIQLLTAACNMSKGAKHPVDYMQSKGLLL